MSKPEETRTIHLTAVPGRTKLLKGIKHTLQVLVQIKTDEIAETKTRSRLQVSCVMDRSGSMQLEKRLTFAIHGLRKFIKHLQPDDTLNVVTYSGTAEALVVDGDLSDKGKELLVPIVKRIHPDGPTNMHAGMELGAKLLREEKEREAKSENQNAKPAIQRIFLFSDGQVNEGVQDENVLLKTVEGYVKAGITVNTFGIGKEFNEDLMTGLARAGKGNYSYLKNAKVIPGLVSKSIHRLFQTVGTEARLFVQGLSGAVVTRVFSGEEEGKQGSSSALVDGILIGDLHANNLRQVLLELEVTPKEDLDTCQVLKCELQYKTTSKVEGVSISDILKEASLPADVEKLVVDAKVPPGASVEEWEAISKNLQLKPGHWQRLKRAINSLRAAQASNSAAKAVKAKEDVKEVSITHNLDVGFTNDRKEAQAQVCDAVLCARAVQDVGAAESAVDEALERGEHKAATAAQKKSLEQLKATMEKLRDKSTAEAKFLQTCIKRGQELLDSLAKDERDARDLQLELRENQRDMRCMSLVRVQSRDDSDSEYSEGEGGGGPAFLVEEPRYSDDSGTEDDDSPRGRRPFPRPKSLERLPKSLDDVKSNNQPAPIRKNSLGSFTESKESGAKKTSAVGAGAAVAARGGDGKKRGCAIM